MKSNYSREERQKIVEEYIQSGKSQTVFAPEYGVKPNTLSAWVTKYRSSIKLQSINNS
ncbi:MAG: transposase [Treponema sp.]|nr:transposase [Treponema sp.]